MSNTNSIQIWNANTYFNGSISWNMLKDFSLDFQYVLADFFFHILWAIYAVWWQLFVPMWIQFNGEVVMITNLTSSQTSSPNLRTIIISNAWFTNPYWKYTQRQESYRCWKPLTQSTGLQQMNTYRKNLNRCTPFSPGGGGTPPIFVCRCATSGSWTPPFDKTRQHRDFDPVLRQI